jgi:hypothetical protein
MKIIPLLPVPFQTVSVQLGGQNCQINIYQESTGLYCDLYVNSTLIIGGVICEDRNRIVRDLYLGFIGDLGFIDNEDTQDPDYTGLGSRYSFAYLELSDLNGVG